MHESMRTGESAIISERSLLGHDLGVCIDGVRVDLPVSLEREKLGQALVYRGKVDAALPDGTQELRVSLDLSIPRDFLDHATIVASTGNTWQTGSGRGVMPESLSSFLAPKQRNAVLHPQVDGRVPDDGGGLAYDYCFLASPTDPTKHYLIGTRPSGDSDGRMIVRRVGGQGNLKISYVNSYEGVKGATRTIEFFIAEAPTYEALAEVYREELRRNIPSRETVDPHRDGGILCTWSGYGKRVENIRTQLQQLWHMNRRFEQEGIKKIRAFILDDNDKTTRVWGDYYDSPEEMAFLQNLIEGLSSIDVTTGVWLAPLLASERSTVFENHPEWFLKDSHGAFITFPLRQPIFPRRDGRKNWRDELFNEDIHVLDYSRQDVQEHIISLFGRLYDAGVRLVKFDYLFARALGGQYENKTYTSVEHLRQLLDRIRERCPGIEIQATSCRPADVAGKVDSIRTSSDSAIPYKGLVSDNLIGRMIQWLSEESPFKYSAQAAKEAINDSHYLKAFFGGVFMRDLYREVGAQFDQFTFNPEPLSIRSDVVSRSHDMIERYVDHLEMMIGDALSHPSSQVIEEAVVYLKRLQQVREIQPVDLYRLIGECDINPISELKDTIAKVFIWMLTPPSMAENLH